MKCQKCNPREAVCYECGRGIPGWGETNLPPWNEQDAEKSTQRSRDFYARAENTTRRFNALRDEYRNGRFWPEERESDA